MELWRWSVKKKTKKKTNEFDFISIATLTIHGFLYVFIFELN